MTDGSSKQFPYRALGFKLRSLREKEKESVPDVSGAVEIDSELLVDIEKGLKLPSEDILLLLISHFDLQNDEAMRIWKLAGYDSLSDPTQTGPLDNLSHQAAVFILPIDSRVVYTDSIQIAANSLGIVVNFQQNTVPSNQQPLTVARVGMSREHAKNIVTILQSALADDKINRKLVIKPSNKDKKSKKSK